MISFFINDGYSQPKTVVLNHYVLLEFVDGIILMKTGIKNSAMLNYNSMTEEMIFESNGKKLALMNLHKIDTIYAKERIFVPYENKFIELVYHNKLELYAIHKCRVSDPGKQTAFGGSSQLSSTTAYSSIAGVGQVYELTLPDGFQALPYSDYCLKIGERLANFNNLRQLTKLFEEKNDQIKRYVRENKVKYEDQESLIGLIRFLEQY